MWPREKANFRRETSAATCALAHCNRRQCSRLHVMLLVASRGWRSPFGGGRSGSNWSSRSSRSSRSSSSSSNGFVHMLARAQSTNFIRSSLHNSRRCCRYLFPSLPLTLFNLYLSVRVGACWWLRIQSRPLLLLPLLLFGLDPKSKFYCGAFAAAERQAE